MGAGMGKFLKNLFSFGEDYDEEYDEFDEYDDIDTKDTNDYEYKNDFKEDLFGRKKANKSVVSLPNASSQIKVVILQPNSFDQSPEICEHLKEKKSVIVNLEFVNKDVARRIIDFVSGAVYGLDGSISKVSNAIFLVAPMNYEITNEMAREELKNKLGVSWIK